MFRRFPKTGDAAWVPGAIPFFLVGFVYYLVSPVFVFHFLSGNSALLDNAIRYLDPGFFDFRYFLDAAAILLSFLLGYALGRAVTRAKPSVADYGSPKSSIPKILALSFGALIVYFVVLAGTTGASFFTGYSTYDIGILGPLSTSAFLSAWFVNYFSAKQIRLLFLSFFVVCSVLLLGWGSRMFFLLSFMALMLGLVSKNKWLLRSIWFYGALVIAGLIMIAVGIVREGGREFGSDKLMEFFFAESFFTSVSGSLYFESNDGRPFYGVPNDVLASIIHFVPSAIFPGKMDLIYEMTFNENVRSPFGGRSLLVSLYSNFGMFYPIFIGLFGLYFGFLSKKARRSIFYRATYFSALPVLTLLFYREGLTTVIKVLLFNGLAVPLVIAVCLVWLFPRPRTDARDRTSPVGRVEQSTQGRQDVLAARTEQS